jgi:ABC-2 type transport system permease protein
MSSAEVIAPRGRGSDGAVDGGRPRARFLRSELRLVLTRRRNLALLAVLAAGPVLIGVAVKVSAPDASRGEGPPFLTSITQNGLFLAFTSMVVALPVFLPLAVAVVSGESVAGEANLGTLRYLLTTPVDRTRLLVVKYVSIVLYGALATAVVAAVGVLTGAALFPVGDVTLLSGTTVSFAEGLLRTLLVAGYVAAALAAVAAVGLLISTLTEVPLAAMCATVVVVVVLEILDQVPQLDFLDAWLLPHDWLAFGDLLRDPVALDGVGHGLLVQGGYVVVFLTLAWARMTSKDVTS